MKNLKLVFYDSDSKTMFSKEMYLDNKFYEQITDSYKLEKYEKLLGSLVADSFQMIINHCRYEARKEK